jgi:hypothetical protein
MKRQLQQLAEYYDSIDCEDEKRGIRIALKSVNKYTEFEVLRFITANKKYKDQAEYIVKMCLQVFKKFEISNLDIYVDEIQYTDITAEQLKCFSASYRLITEFK